MITLHRLGHVDEPFQLNPDLIVTVESTPDTVVTLATTAKVVVAESPEQVADEVRAWRVDVLSEAMRNRRGGGEQDEQGRAEPGSVQDLPRRTGMAERSGLRRRPAQVEGSRLPADERGR
jgi:uncharacterized protein YlzI (FlbEa/FlbD family)